MNRQIDPGDQVYPRCPCVQWRGVPSACEKKLRLYNWNPTVRNDYRMVIAYRKLAVEAKGGNAPFGKHLSSQMKQWREDLMAEK